MYKYKVGDIVTGNVTGIEKYGIFLLLDSNVSGLIHISEISNSFVRNINDYAEIGEKIKAKIIEISSDKKKMKLSIKDINYRDNSKFNNKIIETANGFSLLEKNLDYWIEEKLKEIK